ncbi:MAG: DUF454 domain-containing protein [Desulfuromonadales bacterium]|nr:MAG: DUF454 domain-containing protein [Desulfuromonadales bacterium]
MTVSVRKTFFLAVGIISTALGVIGIFLPLLPTVPFLLLAAACFARSSERCHRWLLDHNHLGPIVRATLHGAGIPKRAKFTAITLLWLTIAPTALLIQLPWVRVMLLAVALTVTVYLCRLPTRDGTTAAAPD